MSRQILIFVGDDYEDLELWYPKLRLKRPATSRAMAAETELASSPGSMLTA